MKTSLKQLVLGAVALAAIAVVATFTLVNVVEEVEVARQHNINSAKRLATISAPIVLTALVVGDLATAEESLEAMNADGALAKVSLLDAAERGRAFDVPTPRAAGEAPAWLRRALDVRFEDIRVPLAAGGVSYGSIVVRPSAHLVENEAWARVRTAMVETALLLAVLMLLTERLLQYGLRPIAEIAEIAKRFGDGDYAVRMRPTTITEARQLAVSFNAMADSLEHAMRELGANEAGLRRAIRESEVANRSKSEFLANMSHELRTPLNAFIGFSSVMQAEMFGPMSVPKYRDYAASILESGEHLLAIINDLLDVSAIEADRLELHETTFPLRRPLDSAVRLVAPRLEACKVELRRAVADGLPALRADERRIKQVLLNLLTNAIDATPPRGTIDVTAHILPADHRQRPQLELAVADSGHGMSPEELRRAFEPFYTTKAPDRGTGLGLVIVEHIVRAHGGHLSAESVPGSGTTVRVRLPLEA